MRRGRRAADQKRIVAKEEVDHVNEGAKKKDKGKEKNKKEEGCGGGL